MKEMTWTREEALKRLAMAYRDTEKGMKSLAVKGVTAPVKQMRERLLEDAVEKCNVMVGVIMAAAALGIDLEELEKQEIGEYEARAFMQELTNEAKKGLKPEPERKGPDLLSMLFG